ncbi:MAG: DUF1284 domain-containing protein [Faecalibacterium prausnitzii]
MFPGTTIRLTFSTDTLCSCCPNKLGTDLCDTQEKVKRYDAKTVEYFRSRGKGITSTRTSSARSTPRPRRRSSPTSAATAAGSPSAPAARISAKAGM